MHFAVSLYSTIFTTISVLHVGPVPEPDPRESGKTVREIAFGTRVELESTARKVLRKVIAKGKSKE